MPGENCAIFGCSTSRRHKGVSIFKIPVAKDEENKNWVRQLINIVTKDRQVDELLNPILGGVLGSRKMGGEANLPPL